jgi:hypothetical protein
LKYLYNARRSSLDAFVNAFALAAAASKSADGMMYSTVYFLILGESFSVNEGRAHALARQASPQAKQNTTLKSNNSAPPWTE